MKIKDLLIDLTNHQILTRKESGEILIRLANGEFNRSEMAAFITVFLMRSIRTEELAGFKDAMLGLCKPVDLHAYDAMDLCGTGGDGKDTFNISTTASFVVAGAGQYVTKHGNNGVSSLCGSSNLIAHFGYEFDSDQAELERSLDSSGICFLHAPLFHPAMKNIAPVRKELGLKTFFNMLGPLVNPCRPKKQLIGVYNLELARLYQYLQQMEEKDYAIVHALDGYDEISLTGPFKMITKSSESIISPEDLGLDPINVDEIHGGNTIEESAQIFLNILNNEATRAQIDVVLANAGLALYIGQQLSNIKEGIELARESINSGKAFNSFKQFIQSNKKQFAIL